LAWTGSYFFLASRNNNTFVGSNGAPGSQTIGVRSLTSHRRRRRRGGRRRNSDVAGGCRHFQRRIAINTATRMQGAELNAIATCRLLRSAPGPYRRFRYLQLNEDLGIVENTTVFPNIPFIGGRS